MFEELKEASLLECGSFRLPRTSYYRVGQHFTGSASCLEISQLDLSSSLLATVLIAHILQYHQIIFVIEKLFRIHEGGVNFIFLNYFNLVLEKRLVWSKPDLTNNNQRLWLLSQEALTCVIIQVSAALHVLSYQAVHNKWTVFNALCALACFYVCQQWDNVKLFKEYMGGSLSESEWSRSGLTGTWLIFVSLSSL